MPIRLVTFGGLALTTEAPSVDWLDTQRVRAGLLVYLATERTATRETLQTVLWPEAALGSAAARLKQVTYELRRALGDNAIETHGRSLRAGDSLVCDAGEFEAAITSKRLQGAIVLYRGPFLSGVHLIDSTAFESWVDLRRARYAREFRKACRGLVDERVTAGDTSGALAVAQTWVAPDPADDEAQFHLIRLLARCNGRADALQQYAVYRRLLEADGLTPPAETRALIAEIEAREPLAKVPVVSSGAASANKPESSGADATSDPNTSGERRSLQLTGQSEARLPADSASRTKAYSRWTSRMLRVMALAGLTLAAVLVASSRGALQGNNDRIVVPEYRQLTFKGDVTLSAIAPDGKSIAYVTERRPLLSSADSVRVFVDNLDGGSALQVASLQEVLTLTWSSSGDGLILRTREKGKVGDVFVSRLGGPPRQMAHGFESRDGRRVAMFRAQPGWPRTGRLYLRILDRKSGDSSSVILPESFKGIRALQWSPKGDRFAILTAPQEQSPFSLWTLSSTGQDSSLVVPGEKGKIDSWTWDASGDAIYYVTKDELWRAPIPPINGQPTGIATRVLSNTPIYEDKRNYISIDSSGDRFLFTRVQLTSNIWTGNAEGTLGGRGAVTLRPVTTGTAFMYCMALSPDQQRIAFYVLAGDGRRDLHTSVISSGMTERITFGGAVGGAESGCPVWSPTGSSLAYVTGEVGEKHLAVVSVSSRSSPRVLPQKIANEFTWSPDGRIVYRVPNSGKYNLLDPKTGSEQPLLVNDSAGAIYSPVFSPDGKRAAVFWNRADKSGFWIISLADGANEHLDHIPTTGGAFPRLLTWTHDGSGLLMQRGDSLLRTPITRGPSSLVAIVLPPPSDCRPVEMPGHLTLVCLKTEVVSDVWMVDHFDPARNVSKK